ncbi:MAG: LLM class F420-dependent oxidoreductase [Thermomicrobiales bacterium]
MPDSMKIGLFDLNTGACSVPDVAARVARLAEDAGFDSLWAGEHVVLPDPRVPPSPMEPSDPILDPIIALTFLAAQTRRVCLGTGIIILPQRNPLVLAKEIASLDVLCGGRFIFGVGVGYLEPEFRALGIPFADRGPRTDDYLAAMRAIWSETAPTYQGRFTQFAGVQAYPRPVQQPGPPVVVGGRSPGAYRRAVQQGAGWYGFALSLDRTAEAIAALRETSDRYERPASLGALEISVTPRGPVMPDDAARYAALGVHRLILRPPADGDAAAVERFVHEVGETIIGRV